jgi:hypothetical protein
VHVFAISGFNFLEISLSTNCFLDGMSPLSKPPGDSSNLESSARFSSSGDVDRKITPVKTERRPKIEYSSSADSEVAMLKALLARKADEALKSELKLRKELMEAEKQIKRLKFKRAADATKIEGLEAELARTKRQPFKPEKVCLSTFEFQRLVLMLVI